MIKSPFAFVSPSPTLESTKAWVTTGLPCEIIDVHYKLMRTCSWNEPWNNSPTELIVTDLVLHHPEHGPMGCVAELHESISDGTFLLQLNSMSPVHRDHSA